MKRKHRPISVERDACLNALGLLGKNINYDHRPPLSHRPYDAATGLYTPDENDPKYLFPVLAEENKRLADGDPAKPLSGDTSIAAKLKRISKDQDQFRARLLAKDTGDDPPPQKRKRLWPRRRFYRRKMLKTQ